VSDEAFTPYTKEEHTKAPSKNVRRIGGWKEEEEE
jgi:hypothetical protein